jgi:hypothetical protein
MNGNTKLLGKEAEKRSLERLIGENECNKLFETIERIT